MGNTHEVAFISLQQEFFCIFSYHLHTNAYSSNNNQSFQEHFPGINSVITHLIALPKMKAVYVTYIWYLKNTW